MSGPRAGCCTALGALILLAGAASAQGTGTAHIGIQPRSAMVTSTVTVRGAGFPPSSAVTLEECSLTSWLVPEEPCDPATALTVMSGPKGRFTARFTVALCPRAAPPMPPVNRERCYIGERVPTGEDTQGLLGAARLTVTYP